jgi:hypothetical protein
VTTDRRSRIGRLVCAAAIVLGACATESFGKRGGLSDREISQLPLAVQKSYDLFAQKCSRCHTLARPLSAAIIDAAHWKAYVERMRHQSGSGISKADADEILVFLKHLAEQKRKAGVKPEPDEVSTRTSTAGKETPE